MLINGKCKCGNISFTLDWSPDPTEVPARQCTCSFCSTHDGVWTAFHGGDLKVSVEDQNRVTKYSFGTETAQFLSCDNCGSVPAVTSEIEGHLYAVVNVNTFQNVDQKMLKHSQVNYDGEDVVSRLNRRKQHWISKVAFV